MKRKAIASPYSIERARQLAGLQNSANDRDWTSEILPGHRRLDSLARLLRLSTTTCAAVGINEAGRLVIAFNEQSRGTEQYVRDLLDAISHLHNSVHTEGTFTAKDDKVLYFLANKFKTYDYVLRVMDGVGDDDDFKSLRQYYESKRDPDSEEYQYAQSALSFIRAKNWTEIQKFELRNPYSKYNDFLTSQQALRSTERIPRDLAKLASEFQFEELAPVLRQHPIILPSIPGVHAEMTLADHFLRTSPYKLPDYMGISMWCCRTCSACMNVLYNGKPIAYRGESTNVFAIDLPGSIKSKLQAAQINAGDMINQSKRVSYSASPQEHELSGSEPDGSHMDVVNHTNLMVHISKQGVKRTVTMSSSSSSGSSAPFSSPTFEAFPGGSSSGLTAPRRDPRTAFSQVDVAQRDTNSEAEDTLFTGGTITRGITSRPSLPIDPRGGGPIFEDLRPTQKSPGRSQQFAEGVLSPTHMPYISPSSSLSTEHKGAPFEGEIERQQKKSRTDVPVSHPSTFSRNGASFSKPSTEEDPIFEDRRVYSSTSTQDKDREPARASLSLQSGSSFEVGSSLPHTKGKGQFYFQKGGRDGRGW